MFEPHYRSDEVSVYAGDCLDVMAELADQSIDAVITDPPYRISFMSKAWDTNGIAFDPDTWRHCLRLLKPGGHLLAFGGTRTHHRLACAIEDAGFEIRDSIAWLYGSGFPKSLDVSRAIDKAAGAERQVIGISKSPFRMADPKMGNVYESTQSGDTRSVDADGYIMRETTAPATDAAKQWQGWGTALKPAFEPIVVARKPLAGTVANNVQQYGTGAINIDACRIGTDVLPEQRAGQAKLGTFERENMVTPQRIGRWPPNVAVDDATAAEIDKQTGVLKSGANPTRRGSDKFRNAYGDFTGQGECVAHRGADEGGGSRFFPTFKYEPKAPTSERPSGNGIAHPTVKPLDLMRWLVRLVTPPRGLVLDPFAGTGTTAEACIHEYKRCIAIEREPDYLPLIVARLTKPLAIGFDFDAQ